MSRPSPGSLARKRLKNEIRYLLQTVPNHPRWFIFQGVAYDLPLTDDIRVLVRAVLEQMPSGTEIRQAQRED